MARPEAESFGGCCDGDYHCQIFPQVKIVKYTIVEYKCFWGYDFLEFSHKYYVQSNFYSLQEGREYINGVVVGMFVSVCQ